MASLEVELMETSLLCGRLGGYSYSSMASLEVELMET